MSDRIEAVLLDMGGVLLPEVSSYELAARRTDLLAALSARGVEDPAGYLRESGARIREAYRALSDSCTQPDLDAVLSDAPPDVWRMVLLAFAQVANVRPYAHVLPVLRRLSERYRIGVVSNTTIPGDHHLRTLRRAGLMRHIQCAVWSANFGRRKPDPAMIEYVLGELKTPHRSAVFVGDKLRTDVLAARNAGIRSIQLRLRGGERGGDVRPDFVIRDLRELPLLLRSLGS